MMDLWTAEVSERSDAA
ncbi:Protein of unknown function [Thermobacillus xylanilyticus]|uniref:Uncharacterized protein n=1 Tax=Thermobacillus xylanilyticus TaxID=76633 RepID=A0ABM8V4C4_THEXY|nr:Protein of unknown function [Thermobacillus xylanilyticus]